MKELASPVLSLILCSALSHFIRQPVQGASTHGRSNVSVESTLPPLPEVVEPAADPKLVRDAYYFAGLNPRIVKYIPCYCNYCKSGHHKSVYDCYVKKSSRKELPLEWNEHAAECYVCLSVVSKTQASYSVGRPIMSIVKELDEAFESKFKYRTKTPQPPRNDVR
jgi:hypothetical protein